jgi:hypothetical protein
MNKDAALKLIKKELKLRHGSILAAALSFNRTKQSIDNVLAGKQKDIPEYLLLFAGLESETTYRKADSMLKAREIK